MSNKKERLIATFQTIDHIHYHRGWLWYVGFAVVTYGIAKIILHFAPVPFIGYAAILIIAVVAITQLFIDRRSYNV